MQIVPLAEFRSGLPRFRRLAQFKKVPIVVTHYGRVAGVLVDLGRMEGVAIAASESASMIEFRTDLAELWQRMAAGDLDCIYLKQHKRTVAAFVKPEVLAIELPGLVLMD
jgi:hypothetical protein